MSRENVELVRALFPPPGTDFARLIRDEDGFAVVRNVLGPLLTDDFQSTMMFPGETRTYEGMDGYRRNWLDWLEPWETYTSTIDELVDAGDSVVVLLRDRGRRKGMDAEVELLGATTFTFREGKLSGMVEYADRAQALEAAGVSA